MSEQDVLPTRLRSALTSLAGRFRPAAAGDLDATWQLDLEHAGAWTITVADGRCRVGSGRVDEPPVTLRCAPEVWLEIVDGGCSGLSAFLDGRLRVDGDLHLALRLETLFDPGPRATLVARHHETILAGRLRVTSLSIGRGTPVVLVHGLAANKLSFLPTFEALADHHEVHVLDLPGFGRSDKPLPLGARYSPRWFADVVRQYLAAHGLAPAHVVGNSMGGRIAVELALLAPATVRSVAGLAPAVANETLRWARPVIRLARSQWHGLAPVPVGVSRLERTMGALFGDTGRVPDQNIRAGAADVVDAARDVRYRLATAAAARWLGADPSHGRHGLWRRLEQLQAPSLWIFGTRDRLVAVRHAARVRAVLPHAQVEVVDGLGHVPQFERPEATHTTLRRFLERIDAR